MNKELIFDEVSLPAPLIHCVLDCPQLPSVSLIVKPIDLLLDPSVFVSFIQCVYIQPEMLLYTLNLNQTNPGFEKLD